MLVVAAARRAGRVVGWVVGVATRRRRSTRPSRRAGRDLGRLRRRRQAPGFIQSDELRTPVASTRIPQAIKDATVAIEDRRFYEHKGVDFEGIVRAGVKNLESAQDVQGGSTLTMQLIRTSTRREQASARSSARSARPSSPRSSRTSTRAARASAGSSTKYLNNVPYGTVGGQTAVGVQAAARIFFDKPASELTLREAALLAGLPQAPSHYNPFLEPQCRASRAATRCCSAMADQGFITQRTADAHDAQGRSASSTTRYYTERRESYFFDYVKQQLIERYGLNTVRRGGLQIYTTIDLNPAAWRARRCDGNLGRPATARPRS